MILFIDTSSREHLVLRFDKKEVKVGALAQEILPIIHNFGLDSITAIRIYPGPGSYTGLRVGFAIANTLGYLLRVPVNGRMYPDTALPTY